MQFTCKCFWRYFAWLQMTITRMTEILSKYMRTTLHCRALALVFIYATDATLNASMRWSVHLCSTPTPQTIAAWLCWWQLDLCTNITAPAASSPRTIFVLFLSCTGVVTPWHPGHEQKTNCLLNYLDFPKFSARTQNFTKNYFLGAHQAGPENLLNTFLHFNGLWVAFGHLHKINEIGKNCI